MKKILLISVGLFLFSPLFSQNHKIEYGLSPVSFSFPTGDNFQNNFRPSVGFGAYGFYSLNGFIAVGLDTGYIFHFVSKTYSGFKIKVMRISPSVKFQFHLNKFDVYILAGYGLYRWLTTSYRTPTQSVGGKSSNSAGFNGEAGFMVKTAPAWELGANVGYHYVNDIAGIKPGRYLTAGIKASYKI
jgi:hypothetical protein